MMVKGLRSERRVLCARQNAWGGLGCVSLDGGCVWSRRELMLSQLVGGSKQQHRSQQPAASSSGSTGMGPRLHHWSAQQTPDHWLQTFALRQGQNQVTFKCQHSGGWGQLVVWGWPDGTGACGDWRVAYSGAQN